MQLFSRDNRVRLLNSVACLIVATRLLLASSLARDLRLDEASKLSISLFSKQSSSSDGYWLSLEISVKLLFLKLAHLREGMLWDSIESQML